MTHLEILSAIETAAENLMEQAQMAQVREPSPPGSPEREAHMDAIISYLDNAILLVNQAEELRQIHIQKDLLNSQEYLIQRAVQEV